MTPKAVIGWICVAVAAALAINALLLPLPGLEWARFEASGGSTGEASRRSGKAGRFGDGAAPVTATTVATADVPVYLRGVGTAKAVATVTVRPQVDGRLMKVHFREGQDVKQGQLIAEIDPATYKAQLDQAVARRRLTQVQLDNAEADLKRLTSVGSGVVTQKSVDTQRAVVAQFEAQLKADEAAIANAEAILGYTRIASPIDGRTGQRLVDEGNLVRAGDAGIVTIAQIEPISVLFTIPQQQLSDVNAAMTRGSVPVEALAVDDQTVIEAGMLSFIDNQIDQATGTVRLKAEMPNAGRQLWPGQFANVRIRIDMLKGAVTVPTASVQRGPSGAFVYVVAAGQPDEAKPAGDTPGDPRTADTGTVSVRAVTVTQQTERVAVIAGGLSVGERVVTSGFGRLKDGRRVTIVPGPDNGSETPTRGAQPDPPRTPDAAGTGGAGAAAAVAPAAEKPAGEERHRRADGERRRERPTPSLVQ